MGTTRPTALRSCKSITIFEGPDGGGKSTAAQELAAKTGARLVHCGPFPGMKHIGRLYLEAMAPALDGYQDVVMDRCWLSEPIYGLVHRNGEDRLGIAGRRMLERVAMRCLTQVLLYLPPLETCLESYRRRQGAEYLDSENKLTQVWHKYDDRHMSTSAQRLTDLPVTVVDYTNGDTIKPMLPSACGLAHHAEWATAGPRATAKVIIVGESFGPQKEADGLAQYPFVSFSHLGCSQWLTQHLEDCGVMERDLLWVNALELGAEELLATHPRLPRVALGDKAFFELQEIDTFVDGVTTRLRVVHPQHVKRFGYRLTYHLVHTLKELIHGK